MSSTIMHGKLFPVSVFRMLIILLPAFTISIHSEAQLQPKLQNNRAVDGEMAFCTVKVDNVQKKVES
ncbi:MAG: hypothetical protein WKG06_47245 [Segetibacter sp.]